MRSGKVTHDKGAEMGGLHTFGYWEKMSMEAPRSRAEEKILMTIGMGVAGSAWPSPE